jgi:hypothetical protein
MWMFISRGDKGEDICDIPAAYEEKLKQAFVRTINKVINDKGALLKR